VRKNFLLVTFAFLVAIVIISTSSNTANSNAGGAPTGNTGSPFDNKTCAQSGCHGGTATEIFNIITSNVPLTGYVPGSTYTITASVADQSLVKFGFQISPQNITGTLLGTMIITNSTTTKFTSSTNKYITHKSSGTSFPGHTATWSFDWIAPNAGTGDVTFYGAFNFSNNNGQSSGDLIRKTSTTIPEVFGVGVNEVGGTLSLNVFPNPAKDNISINYYLNSEQATTISLFDLSGKRVALLANESQSAGNYNTSYAIDEINSGVYVVELRAGDQSYFRKIVKL